MSNEQMSALFLPMEFPSVTVRNRIVMAPMVTNFATPDDEVSDAQVDYYEERARGGVGAIVVEAASVNRGARISAGQLGAYDDRFVPGLSRLAKTIKSQGTLALLQLCHGGPKTLMRSGGQTESISPVGIRRGDVPRVLTVGELHRVRGDFVEAAMRARTAGFDGVEIHAAHFYLLSASLSSYTNTRTDEYGGGLFNRTRLTRETLEGIRDKAGGGFCLWVRVHGREDLEGGLTVDESQEVSRLLVEAGADAIHVSAYTLPVNRSIASTLNIRVGGAPFKETPPGPFLDYAAAVKKAIKAPVVAVGKLDDPALAAQALAAEKCDMVALGRQLLCDPYWPKKVEAGRIGEIIHCKYCLRCHTAQQKGQPIVCAQNTHLCGPPAYRAARRGIVHQGERR